VKSSFFFPDAFPDVRALIAKMTQYDLVLSLQAQRQSATEIHHNLVQAFGEVATAYSTVTRTVKQSNWTVPEEDVCDHGGRLPNQAINARIRPVFEEIPRASIRPDR
jgi:hypothetical protein